VGHVVNAAIQSLVVFVIVAVAVGYACIKLMPAAWRRGLATQAARLAKRSGASDVLARRVEAKLSTGGACGSCDSCKACATVPAPNAMAADPADEAASASRRLRQIPIRRA
jgi:hypothetical protein